MTDTACDRVLAHYRERVGERWRGADDVLFRAAWNEGAHERERQLRAECGERLNAAQREIERVRRNVTAECGLRVAAMDAAWDMQTKLTAANALLVRARSEWVSSVDEFDDPVTQELARDICTHLGSHLAGQRAASVSCPIHDGQVHGGEAEELRHGLETLLSDDAVTPRQVQALLDRVDARDSLAHGERTAAEQRVLDAMAEVPTEGLHWWRSVGTVAQSNVAVAELARREALRTPIPPSDPLDHERRPESEPAEEREP